MVVSQCGCVLKGVLRLGGRKRKANTFRAKRLENKSKWFYLSYIRCTARISDGVYIIFFISIKFCSNTKNENGLKDFLVI